MSDRNYKKTIAITMLVLCVLVVTTLITFQFVVFNTVDKLGGMYDIYRYYSPLTFFVDSCIHNGEFPTWNPLTYCGLPNVGNPQSFLFYPPHLLRSLLTTDPTPERSNISLAIMIGLHFLFMGFCTWLLGRAHKMTVLGALTAALTFLFSALMVRRMCEYHFITTMAWLPLLLLLIKKMIDARDFSGKMIFAILGGLILGMSILGGFLQVINLMGLVSAVYGLFYFLLNHDWKKEEGKGLFAFIRPFLWNGTGMIVIFVLASGVAAVSLIPSWELGSFTLRTSGEATPMYSNLWKWSPLDFYQKMVLYTGIKYEAETLRNSGIIALLLAAAGLTWKKRRDTFLFLGLFLLLVECSFGPPLPIGAFLEKMTPFSMSAYTRAYDFALLPLALLAGFGLDAMSRPLEDRGKSWARALVILLFAFVLIAPVSTWLPEISYVKVNKAVILFPVLALVLMLAAGTVPFNKRIRFALSLLLMMALFAETFSWNQSFVPYMARVKVRDYIADAPEPREIPSSNTRRTDPVCNRLLYRLEFAMNGVDPLHISAVRDLLSGPPRDKGPYRGVKEWEVTRENLRGHLLFKRSFWLAKQYVVGPLPGKRQYFPSASTVFLEAPIDAPLPEVKRESLRNSGISENNVEKEISQPQDLFAPIPPGGKKNFTVRLSPERAAEGRPAGSAGTLHSSLMMWYHASSGVIIETKLTGQQAGQSELGIKHTTRSNPARETGTEVPLPDFAQMTARISVENKSKEPFSFSRMVLRSDLEDEDGLIEILSRTANTAHLKIGPLHDYRILTFLDSWYPGWSVTVDGEPAEMLKTNECFKGLVVPPGTHEITFTFNPLLTWRSLVFSLFVFGLSLVALLVFAVLQILVCRRRKAVSVASPAPAEETAPTPPQEPDVEEAEEAEEAEEERNLT